jgi:hypothetical protein
MGSFLATPEIQKHVTFAVDSKDSSNEEQPLVIQHSRDFLGSLYNTLYNYNIPTVLIDIVQSYCSQNAQYVVLKST